jgi:hypothetical protein
MSIISQFITASSKDKKQTFTSSGTFTVPADVYTLFVTMCAGGGGRSNHTRSGYTYGGGGGGAYYINYPISVNPGDILTITIGAGGRSVYYDMYSVAYGAGTNGGTTKISLGASDLLVAYGGSFSTYTNSVGYANWIGASGGYPNGSGGGGNGGGAGGCGLAKGSQAIGGGHNAAPGAGIYEEYWGMGPFKGVGIDSAQSCISGYGGGEYTAGAQPSEYTAGNVKGESGIVILKWIGA